MLPNALQLHLIASISSSIKEYNYSAAQQALCPDARLNHLKTKEAATSQTRSNCDPVTNICSLDINGAVNVLARQDNKIGLDFNLKEFAVTGPDTPAVRGDHESFAFERKRLQRDRSSNRHYFPIEYRKPDFRPDKRRYNL